MGVLGEVWFVGSNTGCVFAYDGREVRSGVSAFDAFNSANRNKVAECSLSPRTLRTETRFMGEVATVNTRVRASSITGICTALGNSSPALPTVIVTSRYSSIGGNNGCSNVLNIVNTVRILRAITGSGVPRGRGLITVV